MTTLMRDYKFSDADLCMLASNFVVFMNRDAVPFGLRGVNAGAITAFHALGDAFELFPPDEYYQAAVTGEVELKNASRATATALIQLISGFFEQKWGVDSFQYKQLRIKGFQVFTENNFLITCRNVVTVATEYFASLSPIGLLQANIDDLEAEGQTFEDKTNAIASKKAIRDSKAKERIEKGNELFSFCSQYSKTGKLIWENVDQSKYSNYIIYKTSHPGLPKPQNVAAAWSPGNLTIALSWDLVLGATRYEVFYSLVALGAPSGNYNLLNTFTSSPQNVPFTNNKRNYFKIKAKNDTQTSDYSDEAWVDCV